jgi:hypothetical protein
MTQADTTPPSDASGYRLTFGTLKVQRHLLIRPAS